MAENSKIIPLELRTVARRTIAAAPRRPDLPSLLDMLRTIDPELIARFTPQTTDAEIADGRMARAETAARRAPSNLLQPPPPANDVPHLPGPDTAARASTLSALVFPDGSSRILACTLPRLALTLCLR